MLTTTFNYNYIMKHEGESRQKTMLVCGGGPEELTVIFNPDLRHWYLDLRSDAFPMEYYPTKHGPVDPKTLTKTVMATLFFGINLEHFTSFDVFFLRGANNKIAVFTMVDGSGQECGNFYRTDQGGFGYKKAHLYINRRGYHKIRGAQHYLTTEDLNGKWSLLCLYHPQDFIDGAYNEFINRYCLAKGFNSEKDVINHFKNELHASDLLDPDMFVYIDPSRPEALKKQWPIML